MSSVTTLSPSFQGKACATRFNPQLVFGRKATSFRAGADEPRDLLPRLLDRRVPPSPVRRPAVPRVLVVGGDRGGDPARQGSHRGVIEIEEVLPNGELAVEVLAARGRSPGSHREHKPKP